MIATVPQLTDYRSTRPDLPEGTSYRVIAYHDDGTVTVELTGEAAERYRRSRLVRKIDIWRRATDAEAEILRDAIKSFEAHAPKLHGIWEAAPELRMDAEEWPVLVAEMERLFGEQRAGELLAPWEGM